MPKLKNGKSTMKQKLFAQKYVENGFNGQQAALEVYRTTDPNSAAVMASENLNKANVQDDIKEIMQRRGMGLDVLTGELADIAIKTPEKRLSYAEKIRAIEVGLKLHDAFPAAKTMTAHLSLKAYHNMDIGTLTKESKKLDSIITELGYVVE